jgi:hypothetical protein
VTQWTTLVPLVAGDGATRSMAVRRLRDAGKGSAGALGELADRYLMVLVKLLRDDGSLRPLRLIDRQVTSIGTIRVACVPAA